MNVDIHVHHPARQRGHYVGGRSVWFDEPHGHWFPVSGRVDRLEIELEDVGDTSWWRRLLGRLLGGLTSQNGSTSVRFVGVVTSEDERWPTYRIDGGVFLLLRSIPDDPERACTPGMTAALDNLRSDLERSGWVEEGRGEKPWSYRYVRPCVDWDRPHTGPEEALRDVG